jgi:hypothetical protein
LPLVAFNSVYFNSRCQSGKRFDAQNGKKIPQKRLFLRNFSTKPENSFILFARRSFRKARKIRQETQKRRNENRLGVFFLAFA